VTPEPTQGVVFVTFSGQHDDAESDARVLEIEQVTFYVLARAPTGLDLEPHDRNSRVYSRDRGWRAPRPNDVEPASPDGVLADDRKPEAPSGRSEEAG